MLQQPLISDAVDSYQQSLQPAGLHASIHPAYGRRSIGRSPRRPEPEALWRVRISGITLLGGSALVYLFLVHGRVSEHGPAADRSAGRSPHCQYRRRINGSIV